MTEAPRMTLQELSSLLVVVAEAVAMFEEDEGREITPAERHAFEVGFSTAVHWTRVALAPELRAKAEAQTP